MTNSKALIFASAVLCLGGTAQAEYRLGNWDLTGSALLEGQFVSDQAEQHAQFNKYRDISDGVTGNLNLTGDSGSYEMNFKAFDMGRKDQEYRLSGGQFANFGYELFYNEIINHKATVGVKGPWDGIGTTNLTPAAGVSFSPTTNLNGDGFRPFEFSIHRKQFGASVDLLKDSPFFATIGYMRENQKGLRAWGIDPVISTSEAVYEIPEPIDYATDNVTATLGYRTDTNMVAFDGLFSSFGNNLNTLTWVPVDPTQNAGGLKDTALLSQPNKYWNLNLRDTINDLPMESTFTAKLGYSKVSSHFDVLNSANTPDLLYSNATTPANVRTISTVVTDRPDFDGKVEYKSADLALASRPMTNLDTKIFYSYLNKKNSSSSVTYSGFPSVIVRGTPTDFNETSGNYGYFKHHAGAEAGYKLLASTKLDVGYDFLKIHRTEREANPVDTDHKVTFRVTNNTLDWLTTRVRYSYLARLAEYGDATGVEFYDAAAKRMNSLALEFDAMPVEAVDAGLTFEYSYAKYLDSIAGDTNHPGRINDHVLAIAGNVGYKFAEATHLGVYGELDNYTSATQIHNVATLKDNYYTLGTNFTMPVIRDVSDFTAGYQYHRGHALSEGPEYTTSVVAGYPNVPYLDTYTRHTLNAQVSYKFVQNLSAKLGYMFSQLRYVDTRNAIANGAYAYNYSGPGHLSGATNDWDYTAHVGVFGLEYTF